MIRIDDNQEGKQLAEDLYLLGEEEALSILNGIQGLVDVIQGKHFHARTALSIMKALVMVQFGLISQSREDCTDKPPRTGKPLKFTAAVPMDKLLGILGSNHPVDKEVLDSIIRELIFHRSLID